jgi:hypothetical protein
VALEAVLERVDLPKTTFSSRRHRSLLAPAVHVMLIVNTSANRSMYGDWLSCVHSILAIDEQISYFTWACRRMFTKVCHVFGSCSSTVPNRLGISDQAFIAIFGCIRDTAEYDMAHLAGVSQNPP